MTAREEFEKYVALKYGDAYENLLGLRDDGEYRNGLMRDLWPAWQAARATADHRDSVIELCAKECDRVANQAAKFSLGPQQDCASSLADNIRALKSQQDAAIESKQAEQPDTQRLDFMIEQRVWIQWTLRDGSIRQCQVYDQNEDEEYLVVSGEDRYFNTAREALDAAIESQRSGDGS